MNRTRLVALLVLALVSGTHAQAQYALYTINPQVKQADGILFHITSEPQPEGAVRFHFVLSENQAKFNRHPFTELGVVSNPLNAHSIRSVRKLPGTRQDGTLTCVFVVDKATLANPDLCFLYSNLDTAFDEKILFALSRHFVMARLRDFLPRPR